MSRRLRWLVSLLFLALALVGCADAGVEQVASNAGAATDTTAARTAVSDLEDAIEKKEEVDTRLGRAVGRAGGILTAKQQADFVRAFNELPDVTQIEQNYQAKAQNLATELDKVKVDPEAVRTYGARKLLDAYAKVARTPQAIVAMKFGTDVLSRRVVLQGVKDDEILEKVLGPALAGGYLAALFETGSVEQATNQTIGVLETGTGTALQIASWLQKYNAFHDTDVLARSLNISSDATLQGLRTIAGLIAIWKLGDDIARGQAEQLLQDFLASTPTAVTGIASATALFRRVVMGIEKTPLADSVVKWSGKIAVGIGIITNGLALWHDAGKWNDSLDDKVRVVGDVLAIGASILVLVGAGPVGPILATVAIGLSFFADWLEDRRLARQEQADIAACLPKTGLDAKLVKTILDAEPALLRVLVEDVKLGPADVQWLLTVAPQAASLEDAPPLRFLGIRITQKIFDLDSKETAELLHAARGAERREAEGAVQLDAFFRALDFGGIRGDMTRAEALDWFDNYAVIPSMTEPRLSLVTAAVKGARGYLANVN
ncbi:MAG: hypothetical protein U0270_40795 [Labilithrix sp.]